MKYLKKIFEEIVEKIDSQLGDIGVIIIRTIITIIIGYLVLRIIRMIIKKILKRTRLESIVVSFIVSFINCFLYLIYIFFILASLNIPTTSLAAIVASGGVAVGLALKDSLSNIANGIVILVIKPFKEGDYVKVGDVEGTVTEINIATTVLMTFDNKQITLPNSNVSTQNIINYTKCDIRRLDLTFNISYEHDTVYIKQILAEVLKNTTAVISPEKNPTIVVGDIQSAYAVYFLRVWVKTSEFWPTKWQLQEDAINTFKVHNIGFEHEKMALKLTNVDKIN